MAEIKVVPVDQDEANEDMFRKIRGLLAKAESTNHEAEAALFYEKAQQLISKYAVDEEKLWAHDPSRQKKIDTIDIKIADRMSGAMHRRLILAAVANVNNCQMWFVPKEGVSKIAGFPNDLIFVEMLYSAIITQMNFKMADGMARTEGVHHKTFRTEFTAGFADRIRARLIENKKNVDAWLNQESGTTSTALVLVSRKKKVSEWVDDNVPGLRSSSWRDTTKNVGVRGQGHQAANNTDISGGRGGEVKSGRRALNQ